MSVVYQVQMYNTKGEIIGGSQGFMPEYLDWMPIQVKAFWFKYIGLGKPDTEYALLSSQGEQRLLIGITLSEHDLKTHKEKENGAVKAVDDFIEKGGYSRTPRNQ